MAAPHALSDGLRRTSPLAWLARAVLLLAVVVFVWSVAVLLAVRGDLTDARDALERARQLDDPASLLPELAAAEADLRRSQGRLGQPGPALAARVPVLGRTVAAVRTTTSAVLAVTTSSRDVLATVDGDTPLLQDGQVDLDRLAAVSAALTRAAQDTAGPIAALDAQPLGLVPGVVAGPSRTARREVGNVPADLARGAAGLRGMAGVLGADGPRSMLVLLENNAELRGTGGLVTVFAEATAVDGRLEIEDFQEVEDVADDAFFARPVPAPADFLRLYGPFKAATTLWKNSNMSPDVPTSSQVMAEVAAAATGRRPDALLWVDVPAIAAVLRATGPATLPDGRVLRAEDAVPLLLNRAYLDAPDTPAGQEQRRAVLQDAADAVLGQLLSRSPGGSTTALARELFTAARGRHLALWSADRATQQQLSAAGVDGAVRSGTGDLSAFAVHNLGGGDVDGNKLDFYSRRQVTVDVELQADVAVVTQQLALRNTAPPRGLPVYVAGRRTPGVTNNFVSLALPAGAQDVAFSREGRSLQAQPQPEGDHQVLTDAAALPPGTTTTWTVRYRLPLPGGRYRLSLLPQPLAVDAGLSLTIRLAQGLTTDQTELARSADGVLQLSGPFDVAREVTIDVRRQGVLRRAAAAVRRFWTEPVRLP